MKMSKEPGQTDQLELESLLQQATIKRSYRRTPTGRLLHVMDAETSHQLNGQQPEETLPQQELDHLM